MTKCWCTWKMSSTTTQGRSKWVIVQCANCADLAFIESRQPSRIRGLPWLKVPASDTSLIPRLENKNHGKWMLFYDRIEEDPSGLTALDREFQRLCKHQSLVTPYSIKVSTMCGSNKPQGVIILYTEEDDRLEILQRAMIYLTINLPIYWKSDKTTNAGVYSGKGLRASDFSWTQSDQETYRQNGESVSF